MCWYVLLYNSCIQWRPCSRTGDRIFNVLVKENEISKSMKAVILEWNMNCSWNIIYKCKSVPNPDLFLRCWIGYKKAKTRTDFVFSFKELIIFFLFKSNHMKYVWRSIIRYFVLGNCPQNCEILTLQFQETPNRYWFHAWKYIAILLRDRPMKTSVVAF